MALTPVLNNLVAKQLGVSAWHVDEEFFHELQRKETEYEGTRTEATLQVLRRIWAAEVISNGPTPCIRR